MKKSNKKLQLNKETIAQLDDLDKIYGGVSYTPESYGCKTKTECNVPVLTGACQANLASFGFECVLVSVFCPEVSQAWQTCLTYMDKDQCIW